jgi:hypothetical protein
VSTALECSSENVRVLAIVIAYAGLWIAGIIIFADGAIKMASDLQDKVPLFRRLITSRYGRSRMLKDI